MTVLMNKPVVSGISGVEIEPLKQISDDRGAVLHMLRSDSRLFSGFGEIYFSLVNPGKIKAWKRHLRMTQHFAVPTGKIRLVFYDTRKKSKSNGRSEILILGRPDNYYLVRVPPLIWYGFQNIGDDAALLVNCADMVHDPKESESRDYTASDFPSLWK